MAETKPVRVQLSRKKGWRMPPNTVKVSRPSIFGNPCSIDAYWDSGYSGSERAARSWAVEQFNLWTAGRINGYGGLRRLEVLRRLPELRGKNLACWCPLDQPCHADVLLELANSDRPAPTAPGQTGGDR